MIRAAGLVLALSAVLLAIPFVFGTEAQGGPSLSLSPKFVRSGNTFIVTVVDGSRTGVDDSPGLSQQFSDSATNKVRVDVENLSTGKSAEMLAVEPATPRTRTCSPSG